MCMNTYIYMYTCIHKYIHVFVHMYKYIHLHMHVHTHTVREGGVSTEKPVRIERHRRGRVL